MPQKKKRTYFDSDVSIPSYEMSDSV